MKSGVISDFYDRTIWKLLFHISMTEQYENCCYFRCLHQSMLHNWANEAIDRLDFLFLLARLQFLGKKLQRVHVWFLFGDRVRLCVDLMADLWYNHKLCFSGLLWWFLPASLAAVSLAINRDGSSGGIVRLAAITRDGVERINLIGEEIPKFFEAY